MPLTIVTAILISLTAAAVLYLVQRWLRPKPLPGIPHYPITSILGDIPALAADTIKYGSAFEEGSYFPRTVSALGPIFQMFIGPLSRSIVIAHIQEAEDILLRSQSKCLDTSDMCIAPFTGIIGNSQIALKTNDVWLRHRKITTYMMTAKYLSNMAPAISSNARLLVEFWKRKAVAMREAGAVCFSCQEDFELSAMDIISEATAGRSLELVPHALEVLPTIKPVIDIHGGAAFPVPPTPLFSSIRYLFNSVGDTMIPAWVNRVLQAMLPLSPRFRRAYTQVFRYIDSCIKESRDKVREATTLGEEHDSANCMIDMVTQREGLPGQESLSEAEFRDEVLAFIFGGHDTTSAALQWCLKFLTDAPDVQRALRAELTSVLDDSDQRPLTYSDVNSDRTPFLEAVVAETLRCGRVAEGTRRQTTEPMSILGCYIPAGSDLIFLLPLAGQLTTNANAHQIRRLDDVRSESSLKHGLGRGMWDDGFAFKPERWLTAEGKFDPKAGASVPFGLGARACAGKQLALLELKIYIATLNLAFFFDSVPEELAGYKSTVQVTRLPDQAYGNPRAWT